MNHSHVRILYHLHISIFNLCSNCAAYVHVEHTQNWQFVCHAAPYLRCILSSIVI